MSRPKPRTRMVSIEYMTAWAMELEKFRDEIKTIKTLNKRELAKLSGIERGLYSLGNAILYEITKK